MKGQVYYQPGKMFAKDRYASVKKVGKAGDEIPRHSHPTEEVVFICVKGRLLVLLDEEEQHEVKAGEVLNFDGQNSLSAKMLEDSEVIITLIKK